MKFLSKLALPAFIVLCVVLAGYLGGAKLGASYYQRVAYTGPEYTKNLTILEHKFWPSKPVIVRISDLTSKWGSCHWSVSSGMWVITLRSDMTDMEASMVLMHEWAHILAWGRGSGPHGDVWALEMAKILDACAGY